MPKKKHLIEFQWQSLTSTVSTMFVLILLGMTILCMLTANRLSESVRQSLTVTAILTDEANDSTAHLLEKQLQSTTWVKETTYISAEQALKEQTEAMGNDPTDFLDQNPYTPMLELHLEADYACVDSLGWISTQLKENPLIAEVVYQKDLVARLNRNLHKISYVLLAISVVLAIITLVLINNTVRLSVYSRRFIIHTMRLVGASWSFIRRPFMMRALCIGLSAAILADAALAGMVYRLWKLDPQMVNFINIHDVAATAVGVMGCGLLLTLVCTFVSVGHYLSMRESELYG